MLYTLLVHSFQVLFKPSLEKQINLQFSFMCNFEHDRAIGGSSPSFRVQVLKDDQSWGEKMFHNTQRHSGSCRGLCWSHKGQALARLRNALLQCPVLYLQEPSAPTLSGSFFPASIFRSSSGFFKAGGVRVFFSWGAFLTTVYFLLCEKLQLLCIWLRVRLPSPRWHSLTV